jgi:hypothetical protein
MPPGYHPQGSTALFSGINLLLLPHDMRLWSANLWHWTRVLMDLQKNIGRAQNIGLIGLYWHSRWKKIGNVSHWQEFAHHMRTHVSLFQIVPKHVI